jgi:sialate O-acetylesterase
MTPHPRFRIALLAGFTLFTYALAADRAGAEVRVAALIGNHMVIQRGKPVRLWGTADAGEPVQAALGDARASTESDPSGHWSLTLPALAAGGPHTLTIQGANTLTFTDVLVGDVWVASGQSNMEWPLSLSQGAAEAAAAGCPGLRLFTVIKATAGEPQADVGGEWSTCTSDTALAFSAVAFHFGQMLQGELGVPIGLIHASWGGTPAEAWTPRAALLADASLAPMVHEFDAVTRDPAARADAERKLAEWEAANFRQDSGNDGERQGFASVESGAAGWSRMELPRFWEDAGLRIDGAVWFRRIVEIPPGWAGRDLTLSLGAIDDFDVTYWNGTRVGSTGKETPQYWSVPRQYTVPGRLVHAGANVMAVRAFDHYGNGGFGGSPAQMKVQPTGAGDPLNLSGSWEYRIERGLEPVPADFSTRPQLSGADNPNSPTVLWNAMTAPLTPFPIAGAIWYQGESNAERAVQYRTLFPAMITAWRDAWGDPEMPFLFVQLANFGPLAAEPGESDWAELREAQAMTLRLPKTAMAVTIDIGEADDIHPRNKKDVGRRLALQALHTVYGRDVGASGPTFAAATREGTAMRVRFTGTGDGLITEDGALPRGFAVAGADGTWHWAEARIDGDTVVVSSPDVPEPVAVRYAWANNPPNTLRNRAGLPAAPFSSVAR